MDLNTSRRIGLIGAGGPFPSLIYEYIRLKERIRRQREIESKSTLRNPCFEAVKVHSEILVRDSEKYTQKSLFKNYKKYTQKSLFKK